MLDPPEDPEGAWCGLGMKGGYGAKTPFRVDFELTYESETEVQIRYAYMDHEGNKSAWTMLTFPASPLGPATYVVGTIITENLPLEIEGRAGYEGIIRNLIVRAP